MAATKCVPLTNEMITAVESQRVTEIGFQVSSAFSARPTIRLELNGDYYVYLPLSKPLARSINKALDTDDKCIASAFGWEE